MRPSIKVRRGFLGASLTSSSEPDEEYIAFLPSLGAPSPKPHEAEQLLKIRDPSHHSYIFEHHFAHTVLLVVASTKRPAVPISTLLLDAVKAEKSAQRDKQAAKESSLIRGRGSSPQETTNRKSRYPSPPPVLLLARRNKVEIRPHRLALKPRSGPQPPRRHPRRPALRCN